MRSGSPPVTGTAGWVAAGSPCARVGHAQRCDHLIGRVRPHARGTDQTTARTHGYSPGGWACRGNRSGPQRWAGQQPGTTVASTPTDLRGHTGAHRRDGLPPTVLRHMLPVDHGRGPYRTASRIHRGIPKSSPNTAAARVSVETTTSSATVAPRLCPACLRPLDSPSQSTRNVRFDRRRSRRKGSLDSAGTDPRPACTGSVLGGLTAVPANAPTR